MKFRRRFFVKLMAVAVGFLFAVPLMLYYLDENQNTWRQQSLNQLLAKHVAKDVLSKDEKKSMKIVTDAARILENHDDVAPLKDEKLLAVLKEGILGNYEPPEKANVNKPGENGNPVYTSMGEKLLADASIQEYGFNLVASNKIAMDRKIPDTRMNECKYWHYPEASKLPTASVVIVFHNEGFSTLMRTVHSVINTSPPSLLKEVVMVDDKSSKENLQKNLEDYIVANFKNKVKLYRNKKREGLIQTRTSGAKYATGDVIVFLDAHCECNRNWLVPLLTRIGYDRTIMAVPIIESINWDDFSYSSVYSINHYRGIFEWGFLYKESSVPEKELNRRKHQSEPYRSPTHAGGLFAMNKKYFFELGGYDPGLQIWGGENFELSFKIWQCGGSIEWVPCSHVGHVYRNHMPYGFGNLDTKIPVILVNYMRVVEVWLDPEYRKYFYTREPSVEGYPIGNITQQLEFKKDHKCKSFRWFLENVATEVYEKFPPPPPNKYWGEIKLTNVSQCFDTHGQSVGGGPIGVSTCHHLGGNQLFRLNEKGQLALGERCINAQYDTLQIQFCDVQPVGPWKYSKKLKSIFHSNLKKCVEAGINTKLYLRTCNPLNKMQQWIFQKIWAWK